MKPRPVEPQKTKWVADTRPRIILAVVLWALGLWLAWQVVREPLMGGLPPQLALTLAPTSPTVLRRAAEAEFNAGQLEKAGRLARQSLARAPFDVKALRSAGVVEAQTGDLDRADELLTLAGNWSLRDGATHLWLLERRLGQGEFGSAFAHADTLLRRRVSMQPAMFSVFNQAGRSDPRAFAALARQLATEPPWRPTYLASLGRAPEGQPLAAALGLALASVSQGGLTVSERANLYADLAAAKRYDLLRRLAATLDARGGPARLVVDGGFSGAGSVGPLGWSLGAGPGFTTETVTAPRGGEGQALHVLSDSYSSGTAADQLLLLSPGAHAFTARALIQQGNPNGRVTWTIVCLPGATVTMTQTLTAPDERGWTTSRTDFQVPAEGCAAQRLTLVFSAGERRKTLELWTDDVEIVLVN